MSENLKRVCISLGNLFPAAYRKQVKSLLTYSDIEADPTILTGTVAFYGILSSPIAAILITLLFGLNPWFLALILPAVFLSIQAGLYLFLFYTMDRKAQSCESLLPDALQLTASHIRSGLTPDKALLMAARPEFGILETEIKIVAKQSVTGKDLSSAILGMGERINSPLVKRTTRLIAEGIKSGGELATLLEETAEDIRNAATLRAEVRSQVMMYVIFIFLAVGIGGPALYAISTFLVESMGRISGGIDPASFSTDVYSHSPLKFSQTSISIAFMVQYSIASIITSAIISGVTISLIESGNSKNTLKYAPILVLIGLVVFFLVRSFVSGSVGSIIQ
ncbi:MAG: type II secretion system F family protein [archaeon]